MYSHEALDDIVKNAIWTHESLFNGQQSMKLKEQAMGENEQVEKVLQELNEQRIGEDIRKSGFKPNPELIGNIQKFEQMEGKKYTLKELAELSKQKHGLTGERKECFQKIVAECQEQEQGHMQERAGVEEMKQQNFLKQQMQMEQMAMIQG